MTPLLLLLSCTPEPALPADSAPEVDDSAPPVDTGPAPVLLINELMADNEGSVPHPELGAVDWVELYNPGEADVDLEGWSVSDDWTQKQLYVFGPGLTVPAGGYLVLWAAAAEPPEGVVLPFSLNAGGEGVGIFNPDGASTDWTTWPPVGGDVARARVPDGADGWVEMPVGTPGAPNVALQAQTLELVAAGATWAYHDQGQDLGAAWRAPDFDDSAWATGPAPLGYGDSQATTVESGPSGDHHPTTYFRHRFTVDPQVAERAFAMTLGLRVDDGGVVWLGGQELGRHGVADGEPAYGDWANTTASGDAETRYNEYAVDPGLLSGGEGVLAVEVHQANATSSDITMDLTLTVETLISAE
ncbi:MAG: lamin tail domain-containing protein [Alphaproteobacteria bacterium]|nr:lamin tail domain-containing protein [Alphaproteobacteria bacterium]